MLRTWLETSRGHSDVSEFPNVKRIANATMLRLSVRLIYGMWDWMVYEFFLLRQSISYLWGTLIHFCKILLIFQSETSIFWTTRATWTSIFDMVRLCFPLMALCALPPKFCWQIYVSLWKAFSSSFESSFAHFLKCKFFVPRTITAPGAGQYFPWGKLPSVSLLTKPIQFCTIAYIAQRESHHPLNKQVYASLRSYIFLSTCSGSKKRDWGSVLAKCTISAKGRSSRISHFAGSEQEKILREGFVKVSI